MRVATACFPSLNEASWPNAFQTLLVLLLGGPKLDFRHLRDSAKLDFQILTYDSWAGNNFSASVVSLPFVLKQVKNYFVQRTSYE